MPPTGIVKITSNHANVLVGLIPLRSNLITIKIPISTYSIIKMENIIYQIKFWARSTMHYQQGDKSSIANFGSFRSFEKSLQKGFFFDKHGSHANIHDLYKTING